MTKDELVSYVLNSPENTNPNVFKSLLDTYVSENGGGSSGGDSNFSTATLTVTNTGEDETTIMAHGMFIVDDLMTSSVEVATTKEISVILYDGI